jgi:hypothetical protein
VFHQASPAAGAQAASSAFAACASATRFDGPLALAVRPSLSLTRMTNIG